MYFFSFYLSFFLSKFSSLPSLAEKTTPLQESPRDPCQPNPCGLNAQCRVSSDGTPSCSCLTGFIGSPPNCRPECVLNSDCDSQLACINQKCRDPCPGSCGAGAECRVVAHIPNCLCPNGYEGDPFSYCSVKPRKNKKFI